MHSPDPRSDEEHPSGRREEATKKIPEDSTRSFPYPPVRGKALAFLVETAGGVPVARFIQPLDHPNSVTYLGTGKLEEVRQYIKAENITMAVFDDELTPTQLRNIEKELECKILDRTNLILDIFAKNARTAHAKTQVELAPHYKQGVYWKI